MNRTTIETILDSVRKIETKSYLQGLHRASNDFDNTTMQLQRYITTEREYIRELLEREL